MTVCLICQKLTPFSMCLTCRRQLEPAPRCTQRIEALPCHHLIAYNATAKTIISAAKIKSQARALRWLATFCAKHPQTRHLCARMDGVMAAPSSLWSRSHGRFDIAAACARAISRRFSLPLLRTPYALFWRWKKQTQHRRRTPHARRRQTDQHAPRILIVDDVMTTGATLTRTSLALGNTATPIGLTIALSQEEL